MRWSSFVAAAVLLLHTLLLAWSAYSHSPVVCETAHLPAGLSHWQLGRYDLYRVNPPGVRMLAAIPAAWAGAQTDWSRYDSDLHHRAEFQVGKDFIRINGKQSFWFVTVARWGCIPLSLLGAIICLIWANDLYGEPAGLAALALWCFSPSVLGHAALMTPDAGAAALGVAASYAFWCWLKSPIWRLAALAGGVLGVAQLAKTTLLVLYVVLLLVWWISRSRQTDQTQPNLKQLFLLVVISIFVINLGYDFEGSLKPLGDYQFQSQIFSGQSADEDGESIKGNRLASWLGWLPVPFPQNYVQGIDTQRVDFERRLRSYLAGEWRNGGWWYFYFYALAIKVPLGTWILLFLALVMATRYSEFRIGMIDESAILLPMMGILLFVSSQTGFSIHPRYVLPVMPFVFIAVSRLVRASFLRHRLVAFATYGSIAFAITSSLWVYPHSLSYFNELVGGPRGGRHHLVSSAIGWGQDLLYLQEWLEENQEARSISVAAIGYVNPEYVDIQFSLPPLGLINPRTDEATLPNSSTLGPRPGWFAIDVNHLAGSTMPVIDPLGRQRKLTTSQVDYTYFKRFSPIAMAGYSILIYQISLAEANELREEFGLFPLGNEQIARK